MSTPSAQIDTTAATPDQVENRVLWERGRIGAVIMMVAIVLFFVGELSMRPLQRPAINVVQTLNFALLAACLLIGRDPQRRSLNVALCFAGFSATAIAIGAVGVVARDPVSTLVVLNGLALGTAILIPWGASMQIAAVAVTVGAGVWTYGATRPHSVELWLQPVGLVLPSLAVSVAVAFLLRRQRRMVADAERQRLARERGLREANERLETEIRERQASERDLQFALLELDHRVKNTLATLQSITEQTLETSATPQAFAESFRGRIRAMASIHTGLAARRGKGLKLRELIELVVGPYRLHEQSIVLQCDGGSLSPEEVRTLGAALHELATNAAKYGALSSPDGRVDIRASITRAGDPRMHLSWSERSGPKVRPPARHGMGTRLIEKALGYESGGMVALSFDEDGVRCEIEMPLSSADSVPD